MWLSCAFKKSSDSSNRVVVMNCIWKNKRVAFRAVCFSLDVYCCQSGCFRAASKQQRAELRWLPCSLCGQMLLPLSDSQSATLKKCWLVRTPQAWEEVHTRLRSSSRQPDKTYPDSRCSTAAGPRCHPEADTNSVKFSFNQPVVT